MRHRLIPDKEAEAMDDVLVSRLVESVKEVFEKMMFMDVVELEPVEAGAAPRPYDCSAFIGMAGEISGVLACHCRRSLVEEICSTLTEMENEEALVDAWAEVANMVAGAYKKHISESIDVFEISVPTVIVGQDMKVVHRGSKTNFPRVVLPFVANDEHEFAVDMLYLRR